jgi:hypothetical protein
LGSDCHIEQYIPGGESPELRSGALAMIRPDSLNDGVGGTPPLKSSPTWNPYRPRGRFGPSSWNSFYTVLRERFSASERGHLPEQPAVPNPVHRATAEEMDSGYDVLDSLDPALAKQRS